MSSRVFHSSWVLLVVFSGLLPPVVAGAVPPAQSALGPQDPKAGMDVAASMMQFADIDIYIKGPDGVAIPPGPFMVTLSKLNGKFYNQLTGKKGYVRFNSVPPEE